MARIAAVIGSVPYRTIISTETNTLVSDEPQRYGGGDTGFSPDELLAAALGACTCATLRMYANRKQWNELVEIKTEVNFLRDPETKTSSMQRTIILTGTLSVEQKERLLSIANKCPVHKTLSQSTAIDTILR